MSTEGVWRRSGTGYKTKVGRIVLKVQPDATRWLWAATYEEARTIVVLRGTVRGEISGKRRAKAAVGKIQEALTTMGVKKL